MPRVVEGKYWQVYYLVQSNFFAHAHLHRRKIEALRASGFDARVLAFVPREMWDQHIEKYRQAIMSGGVEVVLVPDANTISFRSALFFLRHLLKGRSILVHLLRNDPAWLIRLRKLPVVRNRFRLVLEYEGDQPEELLYQEAFVELNSKLSLPSAEALKSAENLVRQQSRAVAHADGLVLMSEEHAALWRRRIENLPPTVIAPSLHHPQASGFQAGLRELRRQELGWSDRMVLIYTGNIICTWQRFPALCRFVARLREFFPEICLLALVRKDDTALATQLIEKEGLARVARVLSVPASEVASYLCAADFGLYLRHRHPMNMVVTSAKLGEYLACGLPVITTGANAKVLNAFIEEANAGIFLADDLSITEDFVTQMREFQDQGKGFRARKTIANLYRVFFSGPRDPLNCYRVFVESLIGASSETRVVPSAPTSQS